MSISKFSWFPSGKQCVINHSCCKTSSSSTLLVVSRTLKKLHYLLGPSAMLGLLCVHSLGG